MALSDRTFQPSSADNIAKSIEFKIRGFIHEWFTFFDEMPLDPTFILDRLDDDLEMDFAGFPLIRDRAGFRVWWEGAPSRSAQNAHHIQSIVIEIKDSYHYRAVDEILWHSVRVDGSFRAMRIRHTLILKGTRGDNIKVSRYRAEPIIA
jgi:hypothetical protein